MIAAYSAERVDARPGDVLEFGVRVGIENVLAVIEIILAERTPGVEHFDSIVDREKAGLVEPGETGWIIANELDSSIESVEVEIALINQSILHQHGDVDAQVPVAEVGRRAPRSPKIQILRAAPPPA